MKRLLDRMRGLRRERGQGSPFESLDVFIVWADEAEGVLASYNAPYSKRFHSLVRRVQEHAEGYHGRPIDSSKVDSLMNEAVGMVNTAIAQLESQVMTPAPAETTSKEKKSNAKSWVESVKNHPVWFCLFVVLSGGKIGWEAHKEYSGPEVNTPSVVTPVKTICRIDGSQELGQAHDERLKALQDELLVLERKASEPTNSSSALKEVIERLRADIHREYESYERGLDKLKAKCDEITPESK